MTQEPDLVAKTQPAAVPDARRWRMLPVILSATFIYAFDFNVVNVALPSLHAHLRAGPVALELIVGGYAFAYAAGLVTGGRLGDLFGYRRLFVHGMAAFIVASLLCGLSVTPAELVAARIAQGLAAAAMVPQVLALITAVFSPSERPAALAWFGVTGAVSGVAGQVLGGLMLDANLFGLGWRALFFVNLPVGAAVIILARRLLPRSRSGRRRIQLDVLGVLGVSGALAAALIPLTLGDSVGWPPWTFVLLAASLPLTALALGYERRLAARGGSPLMDLSLFGSAAFRAGLGIAVAFMAFFTSSMFVVSLLLQDGLGLTPLRAGLIFGPFSLAAIISALAGRRLVSRWGGPGVIRAGCLVSAVGVAGLGTALDGTRPGAETWLLAILIIALGVVGAGNSMILTAYLGAALSAVRPAQAGAASGTLNTIQQFAGSAGLAAIGAMFFALLGDHPDGTRYAHAGAAVMWTGLALIVIMAGLTRFLPSPAEGSLALSSSMTARDER
jgi:MFS family permease